MNKSVLLTAAVEDSEEVIEWAGEQPVDLQHFTLERYESLPQIEIDKEPLESLDQFENIIYGSKKNARFFLEQLHKHDLLDTVRERLNLTIDGSAARFLEEAGIPAIRPEGSSEPIDMVEFMLRLRRLGTTLYPCGNYNREEIPGLLQELDIPVHELELFSLEGPEEAHLERYRDALSTLKLDVIVFHSRRSVTRILAAFPDLNYDEMVILSADTGVTNKLAERDIAVTIEAEGSWSSIIEKLEEII